MTEHTQEPWKAQPLSLHRVNWYIDGGPSNMTVAAQLSEANARRIVACVNACADVPTEARAAPATEEG